MIEIPEKYLQTQSILKILKTCLEINKRSTKKEGPPPIKAQMTVRGTGPTQPHSKPNLKSNSEDILSQFNFLLEFFFEFYINKSENLKHLIELNGEFY